MILEVLFGYINGLITLTISGVGILFNVLFPSAFDNYWYSVSTMFSGIRALDSILPITELIIFATVGISLKFTLMMIVDGYGLGVMVFRLITFWRNH